MLDTYVQNDGEGEGGSCDTNRLESALLVHVMLLVGVRHARAYVNTYTLASGRATAAPLAVPLQPATVGAQPASRFRPGELQQRVAGGAAAAGLAHLRRGQGGLRRRLPRHRPRAARSARALRELSHRGAALPAVRQRGRVCAERPHLVRLRRERRARAPCGGLDRMACDARLHTLQPALARLCATGSPRTPPPTPPLGAPTLAAPRTAPTQPDPSPTHPTHAGTPAPQSAVPHSPHPRSLPLAPTPDPTPAPHAHPPPPPPPLPPPLRRASTAAPWCGVEFATASDTAASTASSSSQPAGTCAAPIAAAPCGPSLRSGSSAWRRSPPRPRPRPRPR